MYIKILLTKVLICFFEYFNDCFISIKQCLELDFEMTYSIPSLPFETQ